MLIAYLNDGKSKVWFLAFFSVIFDDEIDGYTAVCIHWRDRIAGLVTNLKPPTFVTMLW